VIMPEGGPFDDKEVRAPQHRNQWAEEVFTRTRMEEVELVNDEGEGVCRALRLVGASRGGACTGPGGASPDGAPLAGVAQA